MDFKKLPDDFNDDGLYPPDDETESEGAQAVDAEDLLQVLDLVVDGLEEKNLSAADVDSDGSLESESDIADHGEGGNDDANENDQGVRDGS